MKKHLFIVFLFFLGPVVSNAQSEEKPGQRAQIAMTNYIGAKGYCTKIQNLKPDTPEFERCVVATMYNPDSIAEAGVNIRPKEEIIFSQSANKQSSNNLNQAKDKCNELGFKTGSEAFGNCVLRLSK